MMGPPHALVAGDNANAVILAQMIRLWSVSQHLSRTVKIQSGATMNKLLHGTISHSHLPHATRVTMVTLALLFAGAQSVGLRAQTLYEGFVSPPPDARPIMRWWWFGPSVEKPELEKELETMRGAGIGGVEIQPVYPLKLDDPSKGFRNFPYLSSEFLDDVRFANSTARSLGLRVDITLGSGWPYGGPTTTLAEAAGRLRVAYEPIHGGTVSMPELKEGDRVIAAFAVPGAGRDFNASTAQRIDLSSGTVPAGEGQRTALFFIASHTFQTVKRAAFGAEGYVLDHFSRAAIDDHIAHIAIPLVEAFGSQPPYSVFSDSLEVYGSDWTTNLPAEFRARRGYDLVPHLPELLAGGSTEADAVRHDWGETLSDLIREDYLTPLTEFAKMHHTLFRSQTYGEPAVTLADEAVPNLAEGEGPQWNAFSFTRWASSANHLYNRPVTSAETWTWLHSPAFRATPLDMKAEADRMFLLGVNQIVSHGYPYSPPQAGEPGWAFYAAGAFNSHNPWFPVMPDVMRYLQRMSWLLRQGKPANDVALLLPEDDAQAAFTPGHVSVTDEMKKRISPALMSAILDAGYNVDYIDATTIHTLSTIPYPVLILPPTTRIPLETYKAIARYVAKGGKVIGIGQLPSESPGLMDQALTPQIRALTNMLFRTPGHQGIAIQQTDELGKQLHMALPPDVDCAGHTTGLGFIHRRLPEADIYFVVNTSNQPIECSLAFRSSHPSLQAWDPDSGIVLLSSAHRLDSRTPLALAPYESRVFVIEDKASRAQTPSEAPSSLSKILTKPIVTDISNHWHIRFPGDPSARDLNTLASWSEMQGRRYFSGEAVYTCNILIEQTPAKGVHFVLDFGKGTPTVDNRPPNSNGIHALLDPPIREAAIVFVNGKRAGALWHPPYRIDITLFAHQGENHIEVHVDNTAINELAGQPKRDYSALYAKYGKRFEPQDMDHLKPIPSGLMGPIHLEEEISR